METAQLGPITPSRPPNIAALKGYNVNRVGNVEVIWQPLYEYQTYAAAGQSQLTFFQNTVGSVAGGLSTTNVRAAGQFPRPQEFLVTGIQVVFEVGAAVAGAAAIPTNVQDAFDVANAGNLELFIGSKSYLNDAPLGVFPQQFGLSIASDQGTGAFGTNYARPVGKYYAITPVKIPANQNFNVSLNWPEGVVTTSTVATIGVRLDGFLYRLSQ
jgi:hypothetical protein